MSRPRFVSRIKANEFYGNPVYSCPKCQTMVRIDMEPTLVLASDILSDQCPNCATCIIINMLHQEAAVVIEGYSDPSETQARHLELLKIYNERESVRAGTASIEKPSTEEPRRFSKLPWWKRFFV